MRRGSTTDVPKITLRNVWKYRDEFMRRARQANPCQREYRKALRCIKNGDKAGFKKVIYENITWLRSWTYCIDFDKNISVVGGFNRGYARVQLRIPQKGYYLWLMDKKGDLVKPFA